MRIAAYEKSSEGDPILYSGLATPFRSRVAKLVRLGVKEALKAHYGSDDVNKWQLSFGAGVDRSLMKKRFSWLVANFRSFLIRTEVLFTLPVGNTLATS